MLPLSAADAISPAIARSNALLLRPFRWGTSWKLALVSYLALCSGFFLPLPLAVFFLPSAARAFALVPLLVASAAYFALFYVCARLEFVAFEMQVTLERRVGPMWRRYAARVWPWLGLKAAVGTVLALLFAGALVPFVVDFVHHLPPPGANPDPAQMMGNLSVFLRVEGALLLWMGGLKLVDTLLHDFVLPVYVLEPVSLGTALARGGQLLARNAGASALYLLLKLALGFAGYIAAYLASLVCLVPFFIVAAVAGGLGRALLRGVGGPGASLLSGVAAVLFGLVFVAALLYVQLGLYGYLVNMFDAYAVLFVGGRYAPLGRMLDPALAHSFTPPPPELPSDDDGPDLPLNPAPA